MYHLLVPHVPDLSSFYPELINEDVIQTFGFELFLFGVPSILKTLGS